MSCGLAKQFAAYAQCCLKLAEEAGTSELRDRLLQMAREFMWASTGTALKEFREPPLAQGDRGGGTPSQR
jgi:hypothetical protein